MIQAALVGEYEVGYEFIITNSAMGITFGDTSTTARRVWLPFWTETKMKRLNYAIIATLLVLEVLIPAIGIIWSVK